jgi:hypothetical protein
MFFMKRVKARPFLPRTERREGVTGGTRGIDAANQLLSSQHVIGSYF